MQLVQKLAILERRIDRAIAAVDREIARVDAELAALEEPGPIVGFGALEEEVEVRVTKA